MSVPGTHCRSKRHEFTPQNTINRPTGRTCRACAQEKWIKPPAGPRDCEVCGTRFIPRDRGKRYIYCGEPCRNRGRQARLYGLTFSDVRKMFEEQSGLCLICGEAGGPRGLVIDHCHTSNRVRGLLCNLCNSGLGYFRDGPGRLRSAATYLESRNT